MAGNGRVFRGDGGPATSAALGRIYRVAVDSAGNVFAADGLNNLIVKISVTGNVNVMAGNGIEGFSGDGGLATNASLNIGLSGIALDSAANLYVADSRNHRVRKISSEGIITTVAGNGIARFSGDGGLATSASLNSPSGLAFDAVDNLYIADTNNNRIRKVGTDGTITTVAGNGIAGFSGDGELADRASLRGPSGIAVDTSGNLYIADTNNHRIRKVTPDGIITTVAGNGIAGFSGDGRAATSASLLSPLGVAVDNSGNVYIGGNEANHRIRRVNPDGIITTVAGTGAFNYSGDGGPATRASLRAPRDVAVDGAGTLYIADTRNGRARRVDPDGIISTVAGVGLTNFSGDGGHASTAFLSVPHGLAIDLAGNLYVADQANARIRRISPDGTITTIAGNGVDGFSGDGGPATSASLSVPYGVAVDVSGNLYIADANNNRIRMVNFLGIISTLAGDGRFGSSGDGGPAVNASLAFPEGVAVDAAGNVYIADVGGHRVRKVTPSGIITTVAGNGVGAYSGDGGPATSASLKGPRTLATDASGNLYIADSENGRIRKVGPDGVISTVASMSFPTAVVLDAAGNLYIVELSAHRVRKVSASGIITRPGLKNGSFATGRKERGLQGRGDEAN